MMLKTKASESTEDRQIQSVKRKTDENLGGNWEKFGISNEI